MAPQMSISLQPAAARVEPGAEMVVRVAVQNQGEEVGQYRLVAQGVEPAWLAFEPEQLGAFPGEEAISLLRVHPPAGTAPATYSISVMAIGLTRGAGQTQAVLSLTVGAAVQAAAPIPEPTPAPTGPGRSDVVAPPAAPEASQPEAQPAEPVEAAIVPVVRVSSPGTGQLELAADRDALMASAGGQARLGVALRNAGGTALTIDWGGRGVPSNWLTTSIPVMNLPPGRSGTGRLTVTVPAEAPPGNYPLALWATAREDPAIAVRLDINLEIMAAGGLLIEINPEQAEGQAGASYEVRLSQAAGAPQRLALRAEDALGGCDYRLDPPTVTLPAGGSVTSRLLVRPRGGLSGGDSRVIAFTVSAVGVDTGAAAVQAQGRFVQRRPPALILNVEPAEQRGPSGGTYTARVGNPSQIATHVTFSASDPKGACRVEFKPPAASLPAGGQAESRLVITPVQPLAGAETVTHHFTVIVQPDGTLLPSAEAQARFVQTPVPLLGIKLEPASQAGTKAAQYVLWLRNPRNVAVEALLAAKDVSEALDIRVEPNRLSLAAGAQAKARVSVRTKSALLAGETRRVNQFRVAARTSDMPAAVVTEGAFVQQRGGGISDALLWILLVIMLLLVAGIVLVLLFWRV